MKVQDPRDIITPDAFVVASELLGTPLASPSRRGAAMAVDGLLIVLLANAPGVLLAFTAALVLLRASARSAGAGFVRRWTRRTVRASAALMLFVLTISMWGRAERAWERRGGESARRAALSDATPPAATDSIVAAALAGTAAAGYVASSPPPRRAAERREVGVLAWMRQLADDIGLGFGWSGLYFTAFLALWRGQTPGKRLFGMRVVRLDGREMTWWCAFERFGGYAASLATGLLGFVQIFWDPNRQGIHDKVVHTAVIRL
jgi:hypothetical protein